MICLGTMVDHLPRKLSRYVIKFLRKNWHHPYSKKKSDNRKIPVFITKREEILHKTEDCGPSIRDGVLRSGMLLYLHHINFKIFFHPAKFDNFKDETISDFKNVSVSQSKNLLD